MARQPIAMKPTQAAVFILPLTCIDGRVRAGDWSYCVAPADADNLIDMSEPFPSVGATAQGGFDEPTRTGCLR
ncbi:MAG TPA: hypothetical protein VFP74_19975 [Pseudolabrys sp.]|jgi:hypothetical protein|nr:hypothetical protein [Pseudolabrys sp.]